MQNSPTIKQEKSDKLEQLKSPTVLVPEGTVVAKDSPILKTGIETRAQGPSVSYKLAEKVSKPSASSSKAQKASTSSSSKHIVPSTVSASAPVAEESVTSPPGVLDKITSSSAHLVEPPVAPVPAAPAAVGHVAPASAVVVPPVDTDSDDLDTMAEGNSFLPTPFTGASTESPERFIETLELYCEFKGITDAAKKNQLFKLRLAGDAAEWLASIPTGEKDTYDNLKAAFKARYFPKELSKFSYAKQLFQAKQQSQQSCDDYLVLLRKNAAIAGVQDEKSLIFSAISGFRPQIASYVMEKNPTTMADVQTHARTAEMIRPCETERDSGLALQMAEMKEALSKLSSKFDRQSVNAVSPASSRSATPERRRVSFDTTVGHQSQYAQHQPRAERFNTQYRGNWRAQSRPQYQSREESTQNRMRYSQYNTPPRFQQEAQPSGRCFRCGGSHSHPLQCGFLHKQCLFCQRPGHSIKMCRARRAANVGNPQ